MEMDRRSLIAASLAGALAAPAVAQESGARYGLIGRMTARPGQGETLAALLMEGSAGMPGCLGYVVARDAASPDILWITETWESKESHDASLSLPAVRAAIAKARPLIAEMDMVAETVPLGGIGLENAAGAQP